MATYIEATSPEIRSRIKGASSVNLILGLWLIVAPFILAFTGSAFLNDMLCGIAIAALAGMRVHSPTLATKPASWVNLAIGAWLIVAPFVLDYRSGPAAWNDIVVGIFVLMFAGWSGAEPRTSADTIAARARLEAQEHAARTSGVRTALGSRHHERRER
jgi:hypothetical protein